MGQTRGKAGGGVHTYGRWVARRRCVSGVGAPCRFAASAPRVRAVGTAGGVGTEGRSRHRSARVAPADIDGAVGLGGGTFGARGGARGSLAPGHRGRRFWRAVSLEDVDGAGCGGGVVGLISADAGGVGGRRAWWGTFGARDGARGSLAPGHRGRRFWRAVGPANRRRRRQRSVGSCRPDFRRCRWRWRPRGTRRRRVWSRRRRGRGRSRSSRPRWYWRP